MPKKRSNIELAAIFYEMADIYEFKNVRWKPQAYRIAAQTVESLRRDASEIYSKEGEKGIDNLPGIGEGITKKIIQYIKTGRIQEHEKLKKSLPGELYKIMSIPGIGSKKAALFYNKLGIKNVKELKKAAKEHKLVGLPGFKQRAEEKVLEGLGIMKVQPGRIPLTEAKKMVTPVVSQLKKLTEVKDAMAVGSFRRKKPSIRDIDIVVKTNKPDKVLSKFVKMNFVDKVLGKGAKKAIVINKQGVQIDVRPFSDEEYGAGVLYFTGDKQHNIWLRKIAIKKGWKLNEYGLFEDKKRIAGRTEKEIYKKLDVKMPNPESRIGEIQKV